MGQTGCTSTTAAWNLPRNDTILDLNTSPPSDNSGNYGSTWTDFDLDGDLDCYISKCRVGVFDPSDPRRINMLYVNTDTGYVEMADSFRLASGAQSWSADFADVDNDGDFDIIVVNHDVPSEFFENRGEGVYVDIAAEAGLEIEGIIIQSIFRDFDNDGLVDLLTSGSQLKLYRNTGDLNFELVDQPFGAEPVKSFTIGDFNNDGFPDVYATYNELYNTPSDIKEDTLWLGIPNGNNYIRVKAMAQAPNNPTAVGAKLYLYGPWGTQIREIRAGESYGISTAQIQNFGIGQDTRADSLVVEWPGGDRDVYYDLLANDTYTAVEAGCLNALVALGQGPYVQCGDDVFDLTANAGFAEYLWSNGMTTQEIQVTEPGLYHVSMTDAEGCLTVSQPVLIETASEVDSGEILIEGQNVNCDGTSVLLTAPEGLEYVWNDGQTSQSIAVSETGMYAVTVTNVCFDAVPKPVEITFVDPNTFETQNDTILAPGAGTLVALGDSVHWYASDTTDEVLGTGNTFLTPNVDSTTTFYAEIYAMIPGAPGKVGMESHLGGSLYSDDDFNGAIIFDCHEQFTLDSVKVRTEFAGLRRITLIDANDNPIYSADAELDTGVQWVPLAFVINPGVEYKLTTDGATNMATFGVISPKLIRSEEMVSYPYSIDGVVTMNTSNFGLDYYYYFYDWRITGSASYCVSDRMPVQLVVEDTTSSTLTLLSAGSFRVYPNPAADYLHVDIEQNVPFEFPADYKLMAVDGRVIKSGMILSENSRIHVGSLADGTYMLTLTNGDRMASATIIKAGRR